LSYTHTVEGQAEHRPNLPEPSLLNGSLAG
jgi:hypothetical protein